MKTHSWASALGAAVFAAALAAPPAPADTVGDLTAAGILEATGVRGGLVVHLPCGDGRLTAALRAGEGYLVHGLDPDPANVRRARRHVASEGLCGTVTIDLLPPDHLPYVDNLVRLLVSEEPAAVSADEVMRVLSPGGVAYLKSPGGWRKVEKPWPEAVDRHWTHYLRGPDNNAVARDALVGPPRHVQWIGAPLWTRNHHTLNSVSSAVTADGRLFFIADEASPANIHLPPRWTVVARDGFGGVTLWKRPMESWLHHRHGFRSGPPQAPRLLVACDDRLYLPLSLSGPIAALDAATGETVATWEDTGGAEEIVLTGRTLVAVVGDPKAEQAFTHPTVQQRYGLPNEKSLVAVDTETGATRWRWVPEGHVAAKTLASDGTRVFVGAGSGVAAVGLDSGELLWRSDGGGGGAARNSVGFGTNVLVVAEGVVLFNAADELVALAAEDGRELWRRAAGSGFRAPPDVFVSGGVVWHKVDHEAGSVSPFPEMEGLDVHTGEVLVESTVAEDLTTAGHHYRCYRAKATERWIIAGKRGVETIDLAGEAHSRNNWVRGACQYGVLPANGLLYVPPHSCGCYMETMLHGFWAFSADEPTASSPAYRVEEAHRLETGPAYGEVVPGGEGEGESWPTFRHDPLRSGVAATALSAALEPAWRAPLGGRLTQPVVAEGMVVVAGIDEGTVYALEEESGRVLWSHSAAGRIDSPPTIHEGTVLFGSGDGRVTCLRLSDGELVWRFLAAPADVRTVAFDQLESPWPVHGSVLLLDGTAYFSAGRSTWLDGGIRLYGLDPATGAVRYEKHLASRHPQFQEGKDRARPEHEARIDQNVTDYKTFLQPDRSDAFSMAGGTISDVLVSDGWDLFLHHKRFSAALEARDALSRHLFSTSSLLDDTENHRSHWFLGTGDFSRIPVAYSWIVNSSDGTRGETSVAVPTGVMMVFDGEAVWGVQRPEVHQAAVGEYRLFKMENRPFARSEEPLPDFRPDAPRTYHWRQPLTARVTAMLKSGEHLFLGVMPTEIPEADPHAAYEGRLGGEIWVCRESDGAKVARYPLETGAVWDGMAAANGRLFVATGDGEVVCFSGR